MTLEGKMLPKVIKKSAATLASNSGTSLCLTKNPFSKEIFGLERPKI
jgi:hypothetical protein